MDDEVHFITVSDDGLICRTCTEYRKQPCPILEEAEE